MILANGASHDFEERVVLRRFSLEMRVEVGKWQQGRECGKTELLGLRIRCRCYQKYRRERLAIH
jgi:hypothetical protein